MKRLLFTLLVFVFTSQVACAGMTQEETQTAIDVTHTVLDVVFDLLKRAETTRAPCDRLTVEPTEVRVEVRFQCAEVNDAVQYVLEQKVAYEKALEQDDKVEIDTAESELWRAAAELEVVLNKSGLVEVSP